VSSLGVNPAIVIQVIFDVALLFLILLLFLGRGWRRGGAGTAATEDMEAYREMVSTLTVLIREMKQSAAELQERLDLKGVELGRAIAAADERLKRLESLPEVSLDRMAPPAARSAPVEPAMGLAGRIAAAGLPIRAPRLAPAAEVPAPAAVPAEVETDAEPVLEALPADSGIRPAIPPPDSGVERTLEDDERDRAEKYRQVLEFAEKGWSSIDIARFLQVPRGEVDLLMRTKVRGDGG